MQKELSLPPGADFLTAATAFFDTCLSEAGVPEKQANRLRMAADEVLSNISFYSGASEVVLHFAAGEDGITLTFQDDGTPYNPLEQAAPDVSASAEERPIGGLGLLLVKRLMDDVTYRRRDGQNILTLQLR